MLDELDIEIIRGLADNNMNISKTAIALHLHWNTAAYRIKRVKRKTNIDPLTFYGLCKLLMLVGQMERMVDNA